MHLQDLLKTDLRFDNERGLTVFQAAPDLMDQIVMQLCQKGEFEHVRVSEWTAGGEIHNPPRPVCIQQDAPPQDFLAAAPILFHRLLYPALLHHTPVVFLSPHPIGAYPLPRMHRTRVLHNQHAQVDRGLASEACFRLLATRNITFETPNQPGIPPDSPESNPEHLFTLETGLDADQSRAVSHVNGPLRVLAPAGAGKTKTLVNRVLHLRNQGIRAQNILALAFNRKARDEMAARLAGHGAAKVQIRTFHALGYEIVRQYFGWEYRGDKANDLRYTLLEEVLRQQNIPIHARTLAKVDAELQRQEREIAPLKNETIVINHQTYPLQPIFRAYLRLITTNQLLTYNGMIYMGVRALLESRKLRKAYQQRFRYVLVDEFQDLNPAQHLLTHIIALPQANLMVVGDDDQMIYGWRGASVGHMLAFPERYPATKEIVLSTNYRSSHAVVRHANWLIEHNVPRINKDIHPRAEAPQGELDIALEENVWAQAQHIAAWLEKVKGETQCTWDNFAVLFRVNALAYPIALALDQRSIPHTPVEQGNLFRSEVGRDVFALLTLHLYPHHAPKYAHTRLEKRLTPDMFGRLQQSLTAIPTMQPPKAWFDAIRPFLVIRPGQADLDKATDAEFLEAMQAVATQFDTLSAFHQHISTTTLDSAPTESNADARVQLHTVHTAKGKEFTHVAYFNLGWVSARATPEAVADERRVTYVGLTRAKEHLLVTSDQARPSAFLRELALNSAYHEFAIPYLSRQKDSAQKKLTQRRANLQKGEEKLERYEQEQIDSNDARQNRWRRLRNLQLERETQRLRERTDGYRTEIPDLEATINALSREIAFRKLLGVD